MHEFRLDEDIFEVVKNGTKRVEVRLFDNKRRKMKVGDELVKEYDVSRLYLDTFNKEQFIKLLERFYSYEEQEKYGVVAIEFEVI